MKLKQLIPILEEMAPTAYAEDFVRTRLATKPVSRAHLREQLLSHETDQDAIEQALLAVDDETQQKSAVSIAEKYARQYSNLAEEERNEFFIWLLLLYTKSRMATIPGHLLKAIREEVERGQS